jgi:hypothetical protein
MRSDQALLFVYNCDRGNLSAIKDYSQKTGSEALPSCILLALTVTPVGTKKSWKRFVSELPLAARFLHRDEFEEEFGALLSPAPAVFFLQGKSITVLIPAAEMNALFSTEDLIALVSRKLQNLRTTGTD